MEGEYTARGTKVRPPQEEPPRPIPDRPHPDPWDQSSQGYGFPGVSPTMNASRGEGEYTARGTKVGPPQEGPPRPMPDRPHPDPYRQANQGFRDDVAEPADTNAAWAADLRTHLDRHAVHPHQWAEHDECGTASEHQPGVPDAYGMNPPRTQPGVETQAPLHYQHPPMADQYRPPPTQGMGRGRVPVRDGRQYGAMEGGEAYEAGYARRGGPVHGMPPSSGEWVMSSAYQKSVAHFRGRAIQRGVLD